MSNAELVARLERQFAGSGGPVGPSGESHTEGCLCLSSVAFVHARVEMRQLVKSAEVRIRHRKEQEKKAEQDKIQAGLICCLKHEFD